MSFIIDTWRIVEWDRRTSINIVALNSFGKLCHVHGSPIQYVKIVVTAKPITIRKVVGYAINNGCNRVKILTDAKKCCWYNLAMSD